jgi:hypothetical protein
MRSNVDSQKIEQLMEALGKEARSSGCIYKLGDCFEAIVPEIIRFPSVNSEVLRSRVETFIGRFKVQGLEG